MTASSFMEQEYFLNKSIVLDFAALKSFNNM